MTPMVILRFDAQQRQRRKQSVANTYQACYKGYRKLAMLSREIVKSCGDLSAVEKAGNLQLRVFLNIERHSKMLGTHRNCLEKVVCAKKNAAIQTLMTNAGE